MLRTEQEKATVAGGRAGLICPQCIQAAFDDPDRWEFDMTIGEMVVEATMDSPQWRFVIDRI